MRADAHTQISENSNNNSNIFGVQSSIINNPATKDATTATASPLTAEVSEHVAEEQRSPVSTNTSGSGSVHRLVVIRHSERIDERKDLRYEWDAMKSTHLKGLPKCERAQQEYFFLHDCPITERGVQIAAGAAEVLLRQFPAGSSITKIYASKCLRTVQTAYELAKRYRVPIYLSKGFSLTALHIGRCESDKSKFPRGFQFKSMDYLKRLCPEVDLIDCDADPDSRDYIPSDDWKASLTHVTANDPFAIVVAHRETIKSLRNDRRRPPYCGYGNFDTNVSSDSDLSTLCIGGCSTTAFDASGSALSN